jgi:uncharacterized protein (TIGR02001 family)
VTPWPACAPRPAQLKPQARIAAALAALALAGPAAAQIQATASIASDDRFRGLSVSDGRPVASLDLAFDARRGGYAGIAATAVDTRYDGLKLLSVQEYAGFATRLRDGPTLDLGVTHTDYSEYYSGRHSTQYTEAYVGLIARRFATHLYYSPNYFGRGYSTLYGEVDTAAKLARNWRLSAHVGLLSRLDGARSSDAPATRYDWRLGAAALLRSFVIELAWSGAGPGRDYYAEGAGHRSGVVLALRHVF